jgi:hypothetical protein
MSKLNLKAMPEPGSLDAAPGSMLADFPPRVGAPATRALAAAGIHTPEALALWREADLAALHAIGPKALAVLKADLALRGLSLAE